MVEITAMPFISTGKKQVNIQGGFQVWLSVDGAAVAVAAWEWD
jgi:hypothetical protein